jgi:hypothetical protein
MQPNSPVASFPACLGVVLGAAVLRGTLHLGELDGSGLLASFTGCVLVLGLLGWLNGQGRGGASPEHLNQTGPTPIDAQTVPTLLTIVIGFLSILGPFFGLIALGFYVMTALDPKRRKDGRKIVLSELLPLLFRSGHDREQAAEILAAFQARTVTEAAAPAPSAPAPKPAPKPKAAPKRPATEPLVPPATWGTLEPTAETRADWFNQPVAERAIAQAEPTLPAGEVAPFHVAPASALGDWSLGTSSAITTSSVQTVSYDPPADTALGDESARAPSGFDEALAMLQAKPADKRRD